MLAVMAVLAPDEVKEGGGATRDELLQWTFDREQRQWHERAGSLDLDPVLNTSGALHGVAALLTLAGQQGAIPDDGAACQVVGLERLLGGRDAAQVQQVVTLFRDLYPGEDIGGVAPDLFGDYVIRAREGLPWQAIFAAGGFTDAQALSALTRLNWIAQKWPEEGAALIHSALEANPERVLPMVIQTAVQSGDPIGLVAAAWLERRGDAALARNIGGDIPHPTLALREMAAVVDGLNLGGAAEVAERARLLNNQSVRLSEMGQREDALAAAEEAVSLYRDLAAARSDAFTPDLAGSLNTVANRLSALGRREDALAAAEEAVSLYRDLAAARPDAFTPDLAGSLNTVATMLSALGRREDALSAAEEAVSLRRDLAAARPDAFTPNLAASLNNVANRLSELGRREDALAAAEEAVSLYRDLAAARPDAFTANLSTSLGMITDVRKAAGDDAGAFAAIEEAIDVLTPIFLQLPQAVGHWMAMMVQRYVELAEELGHKPDEQKLAPIVEILQQMQQQAPDD